MLHFSHFVLHFGDFIRQLDFSMFVLLLLLKEKGIVFHFLLKRLFFGEKMIVLLDSGVLETFLFA